MKNGVRFKIEADFRRPSDKERSLLERLLEAEFPGRDELAPMLRNVLVRNIDEDGGLELRTEVEGKASVVKRIPVEAEAKDIDGVVIHMLLHVVNGKPVELEFFREDKENVKEIPSPSVFQLVVLPPIPDKGWGYPSSM
jgi:hypothetical protein